MTAAEEAELITAVNGTRPHVVWIGLGSPKQELWAAKHDSDLEAPLILPVGAAFDFHAGLLRRAPAWMQRAGLEWAFRFAAEPRRLAWRYISTDTRFVFLLVRDLIRRRVAEQR